MVGILNWVVTVLAILATLAATSQARKTRLVAFCVWILTNGYWMIFAQDTALRFQFGIYLALAFLGVWNNRKDLSNKES